MYGSQIFDETHSLGVHAETIAWTAVMKELLAYIPEIDIGRREEARRVIERANGALRRCMSRGVGYADLVVAKARQAVAKALALFPDHLEIIDCIFFTAVVTAGLEDIVDRAEALEVRKLAKPERNRLRKKLESALNAFDAKLDEMEQQINNSDSDNLGSPQES